jgi:hypothetical protein
MPLSNAEKRYVADTATGDCAQVISNVQLSARMNIRFANMAGEAQAGITVFLGGLKKGSFTTVAAALCRVASTVISICSLMPGVEYAVSMLANAIIFLSTGDQVVDVALPT